MSAIDDIRKQVVQHLLERHYQAKERGEEFFFTVEIDNSYSVAADYLRNEIGNKTTLKVLVYGKWERSLIAYLLIDDSSRVFLVGQFDNQYGEYEIVSAADGIRRYFDYYLSSRRELRFVHGQSVMGSFTYIKEIVSPRDLIGKIDYFLNDVKPEIDDYVAPIRTSRYSYYFFNSKQFEEYLATEPNYIVPVINSREGIRLRTLRIQDFRGIKQTEIIDLSESVRWIVLTGENGYGKTSVLQAIAAGLYGNYDESGRELVPEAAFIGVEYYANGEVVETNSRASRKESAGKKLSRELATYGSSRLQVSASVTREMIEEQLPTTYHLFNSDGLLLSVEQLLKDTNRYNEAFYNQLVALFKTLIPQLADIRIKVVNRLPEVLYVEKDETGKILTDGLPFGQLAAGFRNIVAMIGDLVYRLSTKQDIENLRDLQGIVIIDELELHLHPTYQKLLPEVLTTQFPNLQFIVSTHSPIPLLGIPKDVGVVLLHVSRSEETGIVVEKLDVDFSVLTPNSILSSPIFGFKDLIPDSKPDDRMVQTENTFEEIEADIQLRQTINEFLSPERQQELLKLIKEK